MKSQIPYILEIRWNLYGAHKYGHPRAVKYLCIRHFLCKSDLYIRYLCSPPIFFQQDHVEFAVNIMICLWQKKKLYKHTNFLRKMFGWLSEVFVGLFYSLSGMNKCISLEMTSLLQRLSFLQRLHSLHKCLPSHFLYSKGVYNLFGVKNSSY